MYFRFWKRKVLQIQGNSLKATKERHLELWMSYFPTKSQITVSQTSKSVNDKQEQGLENTVLVAKKPAKRKKSLAQRRQGFLVKSSRCLGTKCSFQVKNCTYLQDVTARCLSKSIYHPDISISQVRPLSKYFIYRDFQNAESYIEKFTVVFKIWRYKIFPKCKG